MLEWTQKENKNWIAMSPRGSSFLVYRQKDDYGTPMDNAWCARVVKHSGEEIWWSDDPWDNAADAIDELEYALDIDYGDDDD